MSLKLLKESLKKSPIIKKDKYDYFVHPITDGIPEIKPKLLDEITDEILKKIEKIEKIDRIVTMEAMGIPIATNVSKKMNLPFTIIRKRSYSLPGEISVKQITGYSKTNLYINGIKENENIIIVDDVLSTGGTLKAVLQALDNINVSVKKVIVAIDKSNIAEALSKKFNTEIEGLVRVKIKNSKVLIKK
ncbi:MAG: hypoxanthine/guanine phosphoribosyltransferase [Candidatus Thermoplasmatota archaeon]